MLGRCHLVDDEDVRHLLQRARRLHDKEGMDNYLCILFFVSY